MQCRDVRELADSFVGGELLTETNHAILCHLDSCPSCRADIAARRHLRTELGAAFERAAALQPTPEFRAALHQHLRDAATRPARARKRFGSVWWGLAAALFLAAAVSGGLWQRRISALVVQLAQAAVGDHRNCALQFRLAEKPVSLEEAAVRFDRTYRVFARVPSDDIVTPAGTARVVERHACVYAGRRFAHLVLSYRGQKLSLLVTEAGQTMPPAFGAGRGARSLGAVDGLSVATFRIGRRVGFVTGEASPGELTALAEAVVAPLGAALAQPL